MARLIIHITGDRPKRQAEFGRTVDTCSTLWDTRSIYPATCGADILRAITSQDEQITHLALIGHGWPDRFLRSRAGVHVSRHEPTEWVSTDRFSRVLAAHADPRIRVAVAACSCAASPGESSWSSASYGPGGERSWCAAIYAVLSRHAHGAIVIGHSAPGHASRNPALRAWGPQYGAGRGASLLDHLTGEGAWRDRAARRAWIGWCASTSWDGHRMSEIVLFGRAKKS